MKRIITRFKRWNRWRKHCLNGCLHKVLVLIGFRRSLTFELACIEEEAARAFCEGLEKGLRDGKQFKEMVDQKEKLDEGQ